MLVKTPVRYDADKITIFDADGKPVVYFVSVRSEIDAIGNQIADALNRTADLEAKLATATKALDDAREVLAGWRDRCERLVGHYGSTAMWRPIADRRSTTDIYDGEGSGYDFANAIQKEIDDDGDAK